MQQLMWTLPNKHEDDAKTSGVLIAEKGEYQRTREGKNTVRVQNDSNMLCFATVKRSSNVTYYSADEIIAQEHSAFTSRGEKAVPGFASTRPRVRERGAKAYLRDREARKAPLRHPKGPPNLGSNTAAAKASTQPELQRNCQSTQKTQ